MEFLGLLNSGDEQKHRCEASDHGISQGAEVESSVCDQFHGRAESRRGRGNPEQRAVCDAFVRARAAAAAFDDFGAGESWRRVVCASHGGAGSYHCASCLVHVLLCAEWHPLQSCLDQAEQLIDPSASIVGVLLAGVAMLC